MFLNYGLTLVSAALSKKQKVNDRADVPSHVFMHEAYADVEFLDFTYIKSIDTVAECTDDTFLKTLDS
jgi:hypothetical protein